MCLAEIYGCKIAVDSSFGPETNEACRLVAKGFGDGTEEGVREFQKRFDIGVDGIAGPETFEKLLG